MRVLAQPGLVSVIVASYNHAEYLEERMQSLIKQSYKNIEILVIDDCSTDESVQILKKYTKFPNVKLVLRQVNGGWVAVSNQGIEIAKGEFIIFANCDDSCDETMIEHLVSAMNKYPSAGIAFCQSLLINQVGEIVGNDFDGREKQFRKRCANDTLLTGGEVSRFLLNSCVIPNLSAAIFRHERLLVVGSFSKNYLANSDWDLFFRFARNYDVAYVKKPLNRFRQHDTTIRSATKGRVTYEEFFRLLLGQISILRLGFFLRCYLRLRVMYLWCSYLIKKPTQALYNFPYHLRRILELDPRSLLFFLPAIMLCLAKGFKMVFENHFFRK